MRGRKKPTERKRMAGRAMRKSTKAKAKKILRDDENRNEETKIRYSYQRKRIIKKNGNF